MPTIVRRSLRCAAPLLVLITLALVPCAVRAAGDGPFVPAQAPWRGNGGVFGVTRNATLDSLIVDTNGSGTLDPGDLRYPQPPGAQGATTLDLSPFRDVVYCVKSVSGTPTVYLYDVPPASGPMSAIGAPLPVPNGVADARWFERTGIERRYAVITAVGSVGTGLYQVYWVDLASGASASTSNFNLRSPAGSIWFSPSGVSALVQSALNVAPPAGTNYCMVALCPGALGLASGSGLLNGVSGGVPGAIAVSNGVTIQMRVGCPCMADTARFDYADCTGAPAPTGATCLPGGGCMDGVTQAYSNAIGGTWQGAGSTCATAGCPPPPAPALTIAKSGPASAPVNSDITYVLTMSNAGNLDALSSGIVDPIPTGSTFVSASAPGIYSAAFGRVTWSEGTLAPGATVRETLVVHVTCAASSITNSNYYASAANAFPAFGSGVVTTIAAPSAGPVSLSVRSVPQSPMPLHADALVTHTIALRNVVPTPRTGLTFSLAWGHELEFDHVDSPGTGTVTTTSTGLSWTGSLASSDSTQVVFVTRVTRCRFQGYTWTRLNDGLAIAVRNPCLATVGSGVPADTLALAPPPFEVQLWHTNTPHAGGQRGTSFARPGATLDLEVRAVNHEPVAYAGAQLTVTLPAGLAPAGNPPFVGTPPAGTAWNPATSQLTWSGPLAPSQTVAIPFRATIDSTSCSVILAGTGTLGTCVQNSTDALVLVEFHPVPPGDQLLVLDTSRGLWAFDPATSTRRDVFCVAPGTIEGFRGFDRTPSGELWIVGIGLNARLNPQTGDFETFDPMLANTLGFSGLHDVVAEPGGGSAWFLGDRLGSSSVMQIREWIPAARQLTPWAGGIPASSVFAPHLVRGRDGALAANAQTGIARIVPAAPNTYTLFSPLGSVTQPAALSLDPNGDYLATNRNRFPQTPDPLLRVNHANGGTTEWVPRIDALLAVTGAIYSTAMSPAHDVYLGTSTGWLGVIPVDAPAGAHVIYPFGAYGLVDMVFVSGSLADAPVRAATPVALALHGASPNPLAAGTRVRYALPHEARVTLTVHDLQGRRVATLAEGEQGAGEHAVEWRAVSAEGVPLASGVYFLRLAVEREVRVARVVVAR